MTTADTAVVAEAVERFGRDRARLMDIARMVQAKLGYIGEDTIGAIAEALGIHRVEVRDMVSFYAFLEREPVGKTHIRVCTAVVEMMMGAEDVLAAFEKELGIKPGEMTEDGAFSLATTACMGMSDQAPCALVNGVPLVNLKPQDVPPIISALKKGEDLNNLPQAEIDLNLRQPGEVIMAPMERGAAIRKAVDLTPEQIIEQIKTSRVRGRGGAGFPLAMKWQFCRQAKGDNYYVLCNADEGEPGTFKDRVILTEQADLVFEGMTVAGYTLGAKEGIMYLRGEYEYLVPHLERVLDRRRRLGLLGENISGREGFNFDIRIQIGAGAYICGEESALINSLEGKRGAPRDRPPFPVQKGYMDQPSSVNNVETLCCAARILEKGADWFAGIGTKDSTGTKMLSISGDCDRPGVYEVEYGTTMETLLGTVGAENAQAVQVGGPSGRILAPKDFGKGISFEDLPTGGSIIVFGPDRNVLDCMKQFIEFFVEESCGWCAPCRIGTVTILTLFEKILDGKGTKADYAQLESACQTVKTMSRCGLGQTAANPILTSMASFPQYYEARLKDEDFIPAFDLEAALKEGCAITGRQPHHEE